jgi:perosamine synthetase
MMRLNVPDVDEQELEQIREVLASGYLTQGPKVAQFESMVREYVGCTHAFAMSSCTTALHLALVVLGIGPSDEVVVADFTFPATANVVVQQGAVPVFADIDLSTFTIDPQDLARRITERTRAIIVVDTFGCPADMDAVRAIADARGIPVIEDAACALGSTYKGRRCGALSTLGCFSFHPRKVITTGEGGMITTDDPAIAERIALLRSHGGVRTGAWFRYEDAGFNYRMSDIQGAMGISQMKKLPGLIERRRFLAARLRNLIITLPGILPPAEPRWGGHIYQSFVIRLEAHLNRDKLVHDMRGRGIETTLGTYALHDQPYYCNRYGYRAGQLPNSHLAFEQCVTLPLYAGMKIEDLTLIAECLEQSLHDQAT